MLRQNEVRMAFLDNYERAQLKYQHKHESDGRIRDRIKAVLQLNKEMNETQRHEDTKEISENPRFYKIID